MKKFLRLGIIISLCSPLLAYASDDCRRAMTDWQSREAVTAYVSKLGLESERLRIDDGCYEIRARDAEGNQVRLKIDPSTLSILKLEVRFLAGNNPSRYLQNQSVR